MIKIGLLTIFIIVLFSNCLLADDTELIENQATEPRRPVNLNWFLTQVFPSFQWSNEQNSNTASGVKWQITPIAYSFGTNHKLSKFRFLNVDPYARNSGSVEIFANPEWNNFTSIDTKWGLNYGARAYLPVYNHGEYYSMSAAISNYQFSSHSALRYELGFYALFGIFGVQVAHIPNSDILPKWAFTASIRYF